MAGESLYLVCYDICGEGSETRLRKVYKTMRAHGEHQQYSVFLCSLTPMRLAELEGELEQVLDHHKDQVLIAPLGRRSAVYMIGRGLVEPEDVVRIV